jgi:tetratricopeptide (TPR) repeat protein/transcriptional regulator with XRE-family HTH domain
MSDTGALGTWLRSCRESAALSQEELAERAALSIRGLRNIERGRTEYPHPRSIERLADALALQGQARAEFLGLSRRPAASITTPPGPVHPADRAPIVPRQLPASVRRFVGREHELAELTRLLGESDTERAAVVISAIGGAAGIGKTALAVHFGHQAARVFPDGQLYVNLAGFSPSGPPLTPGQAVRGFLDALGVRPEQIPQVLDDQATLYRSLLAGRRMLVVLDNAADEQQVRPLLPGSPGCMAVVTSRRRLAGLAVAEGAALITVDYLPQAEALQLLAARLGGGRVAAEPEAADEVVRLCGGLPLALAIAAARAGPQFPLAAVAAELADSVGRLDALDAGDPAASIRAVFSWSTGQLSGEAAQMFRLLGIHPGPDISVPAAASLAGVPHAQARQRLGELARAHLITEHAPGRFAVHDLLRAYAADQARGIEDQQARQAAIGRVLDHYLHTAHTAAALINPSRDLIVVRTPGPGVTPEYLADYQQAMAWLAAEHQVLLAAATLADSTGFDVHAWQIPWALGDFMDWRGQWQEKAAIQRTALAAATRLSDPAGQAASLRCLGHACWRLGDCDQALARYATCLKLYQELGDRLGEAKIRQFLAATIEVQGRHADALGHAEQALGLYVSIGDRLGQALQLNNVGWYHALLGDYQQARAFSERSLTLSVEAGERYNEACAWDSLGYAEQHLGNLAEAAACYQRALSIFREFGDRYYEATALTHIGDTRHASSALPEARDAWQQALVILDDLQHPDADKVRAKLARCQAVVKGARDGFLRERAGQ